MSKLRNLPYFVHFHFGKMFLKKYLFHVHIIGFNWKDDVLKTDFDIFFVILIIGCYGNQNMAAIFKTEILIINVLIQKLFIKLFWCNLLCSLKIDRSQNEWSPNFTFHIRYVFIANLSRKNEVFCYFFTRVFNEIHRPEKIKIWKKEIIEL